jgi:DNA-binding transcriptional MerR regulator
VTGDLRTGQVAEAAGVNVQTLRYYERRGLLDEPARTLGGHRLYPPETVSTLRTIKTAQRLGFSLDDVADLIEVGRRPQRDQGPGLRERTVAKLAEIEARIADLDGIRDALRAAVAAGCDDLATCAGNESCPLNHVPDRPPGRCGCCR